MQNGAFCNAKWCVLQNGMQEGFSHLVQITTQTIGIQRVIHTPQHHSTGNVKAYAKRKGCPYEHPRVMIAVSCS